MNRRSFLSSSLAFPYVARSTVLGANDRVDVGIIGLGGRARWLLQHEDFGYGRVRAVADCNIAKFGDAAKIHVDGDRWTRYKDARAMLEHEKLDAVFIETTTHVRVHLAMIALQAGVDVYSEKPLTLTIAEGRALAKAVRSLKRVLQTGTQQRSIPINRFASDLVAKGKIGKIEKVVVCNFLSPAVWTSQPEQPIPEGLNWEEWIGPTPMRPYHEELYRRWAIYRDYDGGGQSWGVTGWGTHSLDQVQAALGTSETGPVELIPEDLGPKGRVTLRYASGTRVCLEQPIINDHQQLGAIFEGTNGKLQILRGDFVTEQSELRQGAPDPTKEGPGENSFHIKNFFDCVKSRQRPNADVEIGHRSTTLCHLVNICREAGRRLDWDPVAERFKNDSVSNALLDRPRRKGWELPKIG